MGKSSSENVMENYANVILKLYLLVSALSLELGGKCFNSCFNSLALLMSGSALSHLQCKAVKKVMRTTLKALLAATVAKLSLNLDSQPLPVRTYIHSKISILSKLCDVSNLLLSLTYTKKIKSKMDHLKIQKVKIVCGNAKSEKMRARLGLPSAQIAVDLIFDETASPLLERPTCSVRYVPTLFYNCPLAEDPWFPTRPAPF